MAVATAIGTELNVSGHEVANDLVASVPGRGFAPEAARWSRRHRSLGFARGYESRREERVRSELVDRCAFEIRVLMTELVSGSPAISTFTPANSRPL